MLLARPCWPGGSLAGGRDRGSASRRQGERVRSTEHGVRKCDGADQNRCRTASGTPYLAQAAAVALAALAAALVTAADRLGPAGHAKGGARDGGRAPLRVVAHDEALRHDLVRRAEAFRRGLGLQLRRGSTAICSSITTCRRCWSPTRSTRRRWPVRRAGNQDAHAPLQPRTKSRGPAVRRAGRRPADDRRPHELRGPGDDHERHHPPDGFYLSRRPAVRLPLSRVPRRELLPRPEALPNEQLNANRWCRTPPLPARPADGLLRLLFDRSRVGAAAGRRSPIRACGAWAPSITRENYFPVPEHCPEMRYGAVHPVWAAWHGRAACWRSPIRRSSRTSATASPARPN